MLTTFVVGDDDTSAIEPVVGGCPVGATTLMVVKIEFTRSVIVNVWTLFPAAITREAVVGLVIVWLTMEAGVVPGLLPASENCGLLGCVE